MSGSNEPSRSIQSLQAGETADADTEAISAPAADAQERTVWAVMKRKPSLSVARATKDWNSRGQAAYKELTSLAESSQRSLRALLRGKNVRHKSFWIVNAVKITANDAVIEEVAAHPDVEKVVDDHAMEIPPVQPISPDAVISEIEWNIYEVRAPEVWDDFGVRGEGIVVGTIDTGAQYDHSALVGQYRGTQPDGSFDHNYNWHDPSNVCGFPSLEPCDNAGHGTHTMGTIVGDDGDENQIGVAPGARWITAKGCEDFLCSAEALLSAGQWMMAPTDLDGENPSPDLRPHIVSNSWGAAPGDTFYEDIVDAWIAAGMFPVFANGNWGPDCASSDSPGDYPQSYSVGAYNELGEIADFSGRGPSSFGVIKPNIAAPGEYVRSSVPGDDYEWYDGTSMATPHVAGAVALLWSAAPAMLGDIDNTKELLNLSAIDEEDDSCGGEEGNNNVWGEGRLDAYGALSLAPIGPTGTLTGKVTNTAGDPVGGAIVRAQGEMDRQTSTDAEGLYSMKLPVDVYDVTVTAFGYLSQSAPEVAVEEETVTTVDFTLEAAPSYQVEGTLADDEGIPVAGATVELVNTPIPEVTTDESGYFLFPDVPDGEYTLLARAGGCFEALSESIVVDSDVILSLTIMRKTDDYGYRCSPAEYDHIPGDTPTGLYGIDEQVTVALPFLFTFYGKSYDEVTVTTNGFVTFEPSSWPEYYNRPIPDPDTPNAAIYPLWDDLAIEEESAVYTATLGEAPNRLFVIEWRDVYFYDDWSEGATFEVILNEMGKIKMQYVSADTGPLSRGSSATIGIENATGDVALQYSYNTASVASGTAVLYEIPFSGFVEGSVTDSNDGSPVGGATITATADDGRTVSTKTAADGGYRMQLREGHYHLDVSRTDYSEASGEVTVLEDQTVTMDFVLDTAKGVLTPATLELVVEQGVVRTRTFTLANEGTSDMTYEVKEAGGSRQPGAVATAKLTRLPGADPNAYTTETLYRRERVAGRITPSIPGDIIRSFSPVGLGLAWGIGQVQNLWLSDVFEVMNHEFTPEGDPTGLSYSASWSGYWPADAAFDESRGLICQLAVGGNNGIHCWDPATGDVIETITGEPWSDISQRGLAYRPSDDTFYVGGWNEGIIYHVEGLSGDSPGSVISSCSPQDGDISGLAYNDAMGVLWVATNSPMDTIYELNPEDCTVLSTLAPPQPGGYQGAGLEMDEMGNLWVVAQTPNNVYLMESGVPAFGDIPWLTVAPEAGELAPGDEEELVVTIDTTGLEPGLYLGVMVVMTNSGQQSVIRVPVSLVVSEYIQAVNSGGGEYIDTAGETWAADQAYESGDWGYVERSRTRRTRRSISGTPDPALYQRQRTDPYAYRYDDVPNGVYEIDLRFAEIRRRVDDGDRLFDVIIEDTLVLPAHDIVYEVGSYAADDNRFFLEVVDNRMDVRLIPRAGSRKPVINALRIVHRPDR